MLTKEKRDLLIKDLSPRLPYDTKALVIDNESNVFEDVVISTTHLEIVQNSCTIKVIPYLRPLASLSKQETDEYEEIFATYCKLQPHRLLDWLYEHHLDIRGLIPLGLALPAPQEMYK